MKYVGVDIGGTNLKAGLVDENGVLLATQKMKVASIADDDGLAWTVASLVQELAHTVNIPVSDVASVGVGVPGTVEIRSGSINYTCNLPLRNVPLRKLFHRYLSIPLYIENDANCAALAEFLVGAGRDSKRFVTITLGTGVGAGIVHNGKIYHGANGMAGEVGHMVIQRGGLPCPCGRHGCWEQYASATGLIRRTEEEMEASPRSLLHAVAKENGAVDGRTAFQAAERGDQVAIHLCREYAEELGCGLVNLINLLHPERVAIGGGVAAAPESLLLQPLREIVTRESYARHGGVIPAVVRAQMGNDAGIIGAALLDRAVRE